LELDSNLLQIPVKKQRICYKNEQTTNSSGNYFIPAYPQLEKFQNKQSCKQQFVKLLQNAESDFTSISRIKNHVTRTTTWRDETKESTMHCKVYNC